MPHIPFYKKICCALLCLSGLTGTGQTKTPETEKEHKFAVYFGLGPNYFINNLVQGKEKVNPFNYSLIARIMWEPEHRLSLGIETGYNRLYTLEATPTSSTNKVRIVNSAIPIFLLVSVKFYKNIYGSFGLGLSSRLNDVYTSDFGNIHSSKFSLGDYGASIGYKRSLHKRFYLGTEIKGFYSSHLSDINFTLAFFAGYRFL